MTSSLLATVVLLSRLYVTDSCSAGSLSRDSEIITDPVLSFRLSPPVRWTFFPPATQQTGQTVANFFPGQSETSQEAQQFAQNEIMAAYLEAIADVNYPVTGNQLTTTVTYSPDQISACYTTVAIPAGTMIGYLAAGAVTQVALVTGQGGVGVTVQNCPLSETMVIVGVGPYTVYEKPVSVATRGGVTMARYSWERVASQMQSILNFRYRALFTAPIEIVNS